MPLWVFYAFGVYVIVFELIIGGIFVWQTARKKARPPEEFRLLRAPGETQRRRVQNADENMFMYVFAAAVAPLIVASITLLIAVRLPKDLIVGAAAIGVLLFVGGIIGAGILLLRLFNRRRNDLLGYLGERAVAEYLDNLRQDGFRIFHDVPCVGRKRDFNIDHVVVGPTGVAAVEVKTRRKKKGRPGYEEHVVVYDGQQLVWPWGEDRCGIDQLVAAADWLRKFIEKRIGLKIDPKPVLVFPGWMVKERVIRQFRVANHKVAPSIVREWNTQPLTPEQVDLISRQLDERCRDVED
jgi:Nuclease-related domain